MTDILHVLGLIILAAGIFVTVAVVITFFRRNRASVVGFSAFAAGLQDSPTPIEVPKPPIIPTDSMTDAPMERQLEHVVGGQQFVTLLGEQPQMVEARVTLHELTQLTPNADWTPTGVDLTALAIDGGKYVFKVRKRDQDEPVWLIGERVSTDKFGPFFIGDKANPGPARKFRMNEQTEPVPYTLPKSPGGQWKVVDIGTFQADVSTDTSAMKDGDRLYFVTSTEQSGSRWLLYLDARQGEAHGTGGLFLLDVFEPSVDVMALL